MAARRPRVSSSKPTPTPVPPPDSGLAKVIEGLSAAFLEGNVVVRAALAQPSKTGNRFWIQSGNQFDMARDPGTGDVLLRVGADVWSPCAAELATLAGMLLAGAVIQTQVEQDQPKEYAGE